MNAADIESFIRGVPKAELHLHIEGSLEPELAFELAERNGVELRFPDVEALRRAYEFTDLQSFLDIYYECAAVLVTRQDFRDLTWAYLRRARADNVCHAEIFFDPQTHTQRGIGIDVVIGGIGDALKAAPTELGLSAGLILCFLRHLSSEAAMSTLEAALPYKQQLLGVGLDSSEVGNPPEKFRAVFERARAEGLRLVAHAGEEGPPSYIRQALELLHVDRIDHGVRVLEDPELAERLARDEVPLTVCPLSNVKLAVFERLEDHNLKQLLDRGLQVTVNSDDPAYFGGYVNDNYLAVARALKLSKQQVVTLAENSIRASFLDAAEKSRLLSRIAEAASAAPKPEASQQ